MVKNGVGFPSINQIMPVGELVRDVHQLARGMAFNGPWHASFPTCREPCTW